MTGIVKIVCPSKRTLQAWGTPITIRSRHPCVSQIPAMAPNFLLLLAWVKITQPNQSHTNTQESFVRKVCLWWGEPFEKTAMSSLARELKILVSVVRFRPGPPRNTKTTFGWFFHLGSLFSGVAM
jgi:hypothetical protein